jgi:hypothetical protein
MTGVLLVLGLVSILFVYLFLAERRLFRRIEESRAELDRISSEMRSEGSEILDSRKDVVGLMTDIRALLEEEIGGSGNSFGARLPGMGLDTDGLGYGPDGFLRIDKDK